MESNILLLNADLTTKSALDRAYSKLIREINSTLDEDKITRWETYDYIIYELTRDNGGNYLEEMKYRLTDGDNPNDIILDIIDREVDDVSSLIWLLKRRIEEYREDDYFKRFYE